jgi:Ni/Co efflux regulator RcnB
MRKLSLSVLAASIALTPSGAFAQAMPAPGYGPQMAPQMQMMPPQMMAQQMAPQMAQMPVPQGVPHRLERGGMVNPYWMGPQFGISNWQAYGFADPGPGRRWIRYYDDAYLIDGTGRVVDTRGGLDWDQYGEQWDMVNGIPAYRGSRDFHPGAQDYAYYAAHGSAAMPYGYGAAMPAGYGYGQGYGYTQVYGGGYGYGAYAYPIVIETVSMSAASAGYTEVITEEYQTVHRRAHRRPRCVCRRPAPPRRPPPGERG